MLFAFRPQFIVLEGYESKSQKMVNIKRALIRHSNASDGLFELLCLSCRRAELRSSRTHFTAIPNDKQFRSFPATGSGAKPDTGW